MMNVILNFIFQMKVRLYQSTIYTPIYSNIKEVSTSIFYLTPFSHEILLDQDVFHLHFFYHSVAMLFFFKFSLSGEKLNAEMMKYYDKCDTPCLSI